MKLINPSPSPKVGVFIEESLGRIERNETTFVLTIGIPNTYVIQITIHFYVTRLK